MAVCRLPRGYIKLNYNVTNKVKIAHQIRNFDLRRNRRYAGVQSCPKQIDARKDGSIMSFSTSLTTVITGIKIDIFLYQL